MSLFDFEKWFIFWVFQTLHMFTSVEVIDYAVPANRIMLKNNEASDNTFVELKQLCRRFQCTHVLYGSLKSEEEENYGIQGINIKFNLYEAANNKNLLQLAYSFRAIEKSENSSFLLFNPEWDGLKDLNRWMVFQTLGAIQPERSLSVWEKTYNASFSQTFEQYKSLADAYYIGNEGGIFTKAAAFSQIIKDHPKMFLAYFELGQLYKRAQNYEQAIICLEKAFSLMNNVAPRRRAECATDMGICYALFGDLEKACNWWEAAIQEDSLLLSPYINLANSYEDAGRVSRAERYFKQALEIDPSDIRLYFNLARLYSKAQKWDNAIKQYLYYLNIDPENALVNSDVANCYLQKGDIDSAKIYLQKTTELDPEGETGKFASFILLGLQAAEIEETAS